MIYEKISYENISSLTLGENVVNKDKIKEALETANGLDFDFCRQDDVEVYIYIPSRKTFKSQMYEVTVENDYGYFGFPI
jgi:hypothetical protein